MPYTGGYPQATALQVVRGRYDFAVDGGAVSTIDLTTATQIPANAVIMGGFIEVDTALNSGGSATVALTVESAADVLAATAFGSSPWSTTGRKSVIPVFTGATAVKTTAARKIQATIAAATLTAGAFDVVLFYVVLPD
jgi:hypothetical protein